MNAIERFIKASENIETIFAKNKIKPETVFTFVFLGFFGTGFLGMEKTVKAVKQSIRYARKTNKRVLLIRKKKYHIKNIISVTIEKNTANGSAPEDEMETTVQKIVISPTDNHLGEITEPAVRDLSLPIAEVDITGDTQVDIPISSLFQEKEMDPPFGDVNGLDLMILHVVRTKEQKLRRKRAIKA